MRIKDDEEKQTRVDQSTTKYWYLAWCHNHQGAHLENAPFMRSARSVKFHILPLVALSQPWHTCKVGSELETTVPPFVTIFVTIKPGLHPICDNVPTGLVVTNVCCTVMIYF